jgi:mRNA interferase MazF
MVEINRGEVWVANLNPAQGSEVGKVRPVLVLQDNALTREGAETIVILPLTSQVRRDIQHLRMTLPARGRLLKDSQVIVEKPMTLDRRRLVDGPLATLSGEEMAAVERTLLVVMGMASYLSRA